MQQSFIQNMDWALKDLKWKSFNEVMKILLNEFPNDKLPEAEFMLLNDNFMGLWINKIVISPSKNGIIATFEADKIKWNNARENLYIPSRYVTDFYATGKLPQEIFDYLINTLKENGNEFTYERIHTPLMEYEQIILTLI